MFTHRRATTVLIVLVSSAVLLVLLGLFLLPRSLVKAHVCSFAFHDSVLSDACSPSESSLTTSNVSAESSAKSEKTLGIATSIYVVSLARRTDRRRIMDMLKDALNLEWTYFDALEKDDPLVESILHSVARRRADGSSVQEFKWPEDADDSTAPPQILDKEYMVHDDLALRNVTVEPLVCATADNTIRSYTAPSLIPFHMRLSRGMVACWCSHIRLMADIVKRTSQIRRSSWDGKEGVSVVFEDDIDMEWDLKGRAREMWTDLPRNWDIVMLGHCWSNESTNAPLTSSSPLHPSHSPKCTHAYVLSPFGARHLLAHLTYPPFAFSRALDQAIAHLISTKRIRSFSVVPSIVVQRRCPVDNSINSECIYESSGDGDSDIWVTEGKKGSLWRDSLEDGAYARIRSARDWSIESG